MFCYFMYVNDDQVHIGNVNSTGVSTPRDHLTSGNNWLSSSLACEWHL